jgi:hypothetical protein
MSRDFTNKDAVLNLRYGIGCAVEGTFAIWLLIHAESYRPLGVWVVAYLMLAMGTVCLLAGFVWYFCWAYERNATRWYLAAVASLIGAVCFGLDRLFSFGFGEWDVVLSFSIFYFAAGYAAWRLCRFFAVRSFDILLMAVSELGAAWRGELRH